VVPEAKKQTLKDNEGSATPSNQWRRTTMSIFDRINKKISDNLYAHGHYLTDPHANDHEKIAEMVDDLMQFVKDDSRAKVREKIMALIRRHKHPDVEFDGHAFGEKG
jgi:hypothetical protein